MFIWDKPDPDPIGTHQRRLMRMGHQPTCLAVQELHEYRCDCGRGWEHRSPLEQIRKRLANLFWARRTEPLPSWWQYKLGYWTEARRQRLLRKINKL